MTGFEYYKACITDKYFDFDGRARRSEYWYYVLFNMIFYIVSFMLSSIITVMIDNAFGFIIVILYAIAMIIPSLAVLIRRLHDTNKSGWWILINIIPFGGIVLFVFLLSDGDRGKNSYGNDPKRKENLDFEFETVQNQQI